MKALLPLSLVVTLAVAPAFADCVAPLIDLRIPNGHKATMDEMVAANHALQESTTELDAYAHCLKVEQQAQIDEIGQDITDEQRSKIGSEYASRLQAENDKLQDLSNQYDAAVRNFRGEQAAEISTEQSNEEAAALKAADQDAAEKARQEATDQKTEEKAERPLPNGN